MNFLPKKKETLIYIFWTCSETNLFWQDFKQWLINCTEFSNALNLSPSLVLGLKPDDLHFLVARFFVWVCKMRNNLPKIENFSPFLSFYNTVKPSFDIHSK